MRKNNRFLICLSSILFVLLILNFFLIFFKEKPIEKNEIYVSFIVDVDRAGFDVNSSALTFGIIPSGGSSSRTLNLFNEYPYSIKVDVKADKNISRQIVFQSPIYLDAFEHKNVSISIVVPENLSLGNYSGFLYFESYRV